MRCQWWSLANSSFTTTTTDTPSPSSLPLAFGTPQPSSLTSIPSPKPSHLSPSFASLPSQLTYLKIAAVRPLPSTSSAFMHPTPSILFNKSPNLTKSPLLSLIFSVLRLYLWEKILTSLLFTSLPLVLLPLLLSFKSQSLINKPLEEASKICPTWSSILRVCHR